MNGRSRATLSEVWCVLATLGAAVLLTGCQTVNSFVDATDENPGDNICARALTWAEISSGLPVSNRCTLRAAVMEANAWGLKFYINIPAGTYHLNLPAAAGGGPLVISHNMRIQGSGAAATIIQQEIGSAVLMVAGGESVDVNHVTLQGGGKPSILDGSSSVIAGGGMFVATGAMVKLEDIAIRDNQAFTGGGGLLIQQGATVRISRSTLSGNQAVGAFGGGIWNEGELWVDNSTVSGNDSNRTGAIRNEGNMRLQNVTVSGNTTHSDSAAVGGISQNGFAILNNVTITNNHGFGNAAGSFVGGGIQTSAGKVTSIKNSIVAGNFGHGGPDDCEGALSSDSKYNLIGNSNGCAITGYVGTYRLDIPAGLGVLNDNGGPTLTHRPQTTSPARDAANPFLLPTVDACGPRDQRGVRRPEGIGPCDMGAYEYTTTSVFVTGFMLVDADTNTDIRPLRNDDGLLLTALPPQLTVRAITSGGVAGSVQFGFGNDPNLRLIKFVPYEADYHLENIAPYALAGDNVGDYYSVPLVTGAYILTATPFAGANATGAAGGALTIRFQVLESF